MKLLSEDIYIYIFIYIYVCVYLRIWVKKIVFFLYFFNCVIFLTEMVIVYCSFKLSRQIYLILVLKV